MQNFFNSADEYLFANINSVQTLSLSTLCINVFSHKYLRPSSMQASARPSKSEATFGEKFVIEPEYRYSIIKRYELQPQSLTSIYDYEDSFMPLINIARKCSHQADKIALWAQIGLFSTRKITSLNVGLFIIFLIFVINEFTASLLISFSSSLPMSRMQISLSHLQPSKPPKINNYFMPITHAVCR